MSCEKISCPECISPPFPPFGGESMTERLHEVEIENDHFDSQLIENRHVAFIWIYVNRTVVET